MKKKIISTVAAALLLATMCMPAYASEVDVEGYGEELGYEDTSAGYAYTDPNKQNNTGITTFAAAGSYTYLWDVTVGSLGPGKLLTTGSNNKKIAAKYKTIKVTGPKNNNGKVGACYKKADGSWKSIGSSQMSAKSVSFSITHKSGKTTRGFYKNIGDGYANNLTYSFYGK